MPPMNIRVQSACRIACIDRDRFNEAVAAGNCAWAPEVVRGSTRVFDEIGLIVLTYYSSLTRNDEYPPSLAGRMALRLDKQLRKTPDENEIVLIRALNGAWHSMAGSSLKDRPHVYGGVAVMETRYVNVESLRTYVRREAENETGIEEQDDG